ncbi:unnamed protein product, partial [marine sediment metagenome]
MVEWHKVINGKTNPGPAEQAKLLSNLQLIVKNTYTDQEIKDHAEYIVKIMEHVLGLQSCKMPARQKLRCNFATGCKSYFIDWLNSTAKTTYHSFCLQQDQRKIDMYPDEFFIPLNSINELCKLLEEKCSDAPPCGLKEVQDCLLDWISKWDKSRKKKIEEKAEYF